jgi:hypothetical protein
MGRVDEHQLTFVSAGGCWKNEEGLWQDIIKIKYVKESPI